MNNVLIGQSGGPTAVINASLFGIISEAACHSEVDRIYGMLYGIEGFLNDRYIDMEELPDIDKIALRTTPGAYLGSCRYKLPEDLSDPVYARLFEKFKLLDISIFLYIGGNDSMDTVSKLTGYPKKTGSDIRIAGIPKTIDNDLEVTDHTPGYGSAARFVASAVREINCDASVYNKKSVTIVEIMGRHAGWLTAASALARQYKTDNPVLIYLPETDFDEEKFLAAIKRAFLKKQNLIVCVSEGIHDASGKFICEYVAETKTDSFGHKLLNGCGKYLENLIKKSMDVKVRSVELNVLQRCSSDCLSATDLDEAESAGRYGFRTALKGETGFMSALKRTSDIPYTLEYTAVDVNQVCNKEKKVPLSWITEDGTDISEEFLVYVRPLIQGTCTLPVKEGLNYFACRR